MDESPGVGHQLVLNIYHEINFVLYVMYEHSWGFYHDGRMNNEWQWNSRFDRFHGLYELWPWEDRVKHYNISKAVGGISQI